MTYLCDSYYRLCIGHQRISSIKAQWSGNVKLWCFLCCWPEQGVERTINWVAIDLRHHRNLHTDQEETIWTNVISMQLMLQCCWIQNDLSSAVTYEKCIDDSVQLRRWYLQCFSNGDTTALPYVIGMPIKQGVSSFSVDPWSNKCQTDVLSFLNHYSDVIIIAMASQFPASQLFTQPFVQVQIKDNIKAPRY